MAPIIDNLTASLLLQQQQDKLVICWGMGQDSTGMILGCEERGIRPWKIIFADVGSEKRGTYAFKPEFDDWLKAHGFPSVDVVRYVPKRFKHWPHYYTLLENCLTNVTLPSLTYGGHTCSAKWKITAINAFLKKDPHALAVWRQRGKLIKAIGFDDSDKERKRAERGCRTFYTKGDEKDHYELLYPLQAWGWSREDCVEAIQRHGLTVPPKSSCYFCPAMKPDEVDLLDEQELRVIVIIEWRTRQRHLNRAQRDGWPLGVGVAKIDGLWRKGAKGKRKGVVKRPGAITEYIREHGLLPSSEIDRIQSRTSQALYTKADFEKLGYASWTDWIEDIVAPEPEGRPALVSTGQLMLSL